MPISFICPHCGRHTDVAEKFAGQTGPCAGCGRPVAVPTLAEAAEQGQGTSGRGAVGLAIGGLLAIIVCVAGAAFLIPSLLRVQGQNQLTAAESNLKTLVGAMQQYHDNWGCFPPAITYGPDGVTPFHSWRVLLLPYLEQDVLYTQYNLREPWNSPNNRFVMQQMPSVFSDGAQRSNNATSFVVVTGDRTMFPLQTSTSRKDAAKGQSATALIVESAFSQVIWTEPKDLAFDNMNFAINDPNGQCISGAAPEGALVAMVDGTTQIVNELSFGEPNVQSLLLRDAAPLGGASLGVAAIYTQPVDLLRKFESIRFGDLANQSIDETMHGGDEGNTLSLLGAGSKVLGGVPFIVEPRILCLGNKEGIAAHLPERIDGIPVVNKRADRLHFLHATGWKAPKDGTPIGHYEIHYADGTTEMVKIVYGVDVRDWWDSDGTLAVDDGRMVWTGSNPAIMQQSPGAQQIRLFMSTWKNPRPEADIATIDFVGYKATECAPFCVAITIDNPGPGSEPEPAVDATSSSTESQEQVTEPAATAPDETAAEAPAAPADEETKPDEAPAEPAAVAPETAPNP